MEDIRFSYLSPQQYCGAALIINNDILDILNETVADFTVLSLNHVISGDSLINLYDPISNSLSEFSTYGRSNGVSIISSLKQSPGNVIELPDLPLAGCVKLLFDFSDAELAAKGIFGCLREARELDSTKSTIVDLLKSSVYLPSNYNFTTIMNALHAMDENVPSYGYHFQQVYEYTNELQSLRDAVMCGDFTLGTIGDVLILKVDSMEEFYSLTQYSEADVINMLISQQPDGFVADSILECINYRLAKKYDFVRGSEVGSILIYVMRGDTSQFRTPISPDYDELSTNLLKEVSEESAARGILQKALYLAAAGESKVADLASYLGQGYDGTFASAKDLISTLSSYGSSLTSSVASAVQGVYQAIADAQPVGDREINWGTLPVPTYDTTLGSVIVGVAATASQIIGAALVMFGGVVVKLAGAALLAVGYVIQGISTAIADAADTFPDFSGDSIDRLFGYPIYQKDTVDVSGLSLDIVGHLSRYGALKLVYPWCVVFLYNYKKDNKVADMKVFINVTSCSANGEYGSYHFTWSDGYDEYCELEAMSSSLSGDMYVSYSDTILSPMAMKEGVRDSLLINSLNPNEGRGKIFMHNCSPEYYNVHSKNSDDYFNLWTNVAFNAAMTLLLFMTDPLTDKSFHAYATGGGQIKFDPNHGAENLWLTIMAYAFRIHTPNPATSNILYLRNVGGCVLKTYDNSSITTFIMNAFLPWVSEAISSLGPSTLFTDGICSEMAIQVPWAGVDAKYAITPPARRLQSLIFAVVLVVAVTVAALVTFTVIKKVVQRRMQPIWFNKVQALSAEREALASLKPVTAEDKRAQALIAKEYFKRVRKFNLISSLLGMGTYNPMADWYEGTGTIGGTWSQASDVSEVSALTGMNSSNATGTQLDRAFTNPETGEVITMGDLLSKSNDILIDTASIKDNIAEIKNYSIAIKHLING